MIAAYKPTRIRSRRGSDSAKYLEWLEERRLFSFHHFVLHTTTAAQSPGVVQALVSSPPVITNPPPNASDNVGTLYTFTLTATGSPTPTFSLSSGPSGMTINRTTGTITWTPTISQVGTPTITVKASNSAGSQSKSFQITVTNYKVPVFTAPGNRTATIGAPFALQIAATGTPAPTYSFQNAPAGMTIDSSGYITWNPDASFLGSQNVTVNASNVAGTASTSFTVSVVPDTTPPTAPYVTVGPITAVDSIPLSFTATDNVGVAFYRIYQFTPAVYKGHSGRDGGYTLVSPAKYTLLVDNVAGNDYTFTGLLPNSTHQYAVAAVDTSGNQSAYSAVVIGTTLLQPSFTWDLYGADTNPPLTVVANHPLTFYFNTTGSPSPTLQMDSAPDGVVYTPGVITNSQLTYVIAHINWTPTEDQVGTQYITMEAINSVGDYTYSIPVTVTPDTPSLAVTINGGTVYGPAQYAAGQSNYNVTANYYLSSAASPQYAMSGVPFNFQVSDSSNSQPTTYALVSGPADMTLDPNTGAGAWTPDKTQGGTTQVVIAATNSAGTSTMELSFQTYFTGAPGTPSAVYYTNTSGAAVYSPTISWAAPADTVGIVGYLVTVTDAHTNAVTTFDTQSPASSIALSGLGGQQYFVTVTPYDAGGNLAMTSTAISIYGYALSPLTWTAPTATAGSPATVQFSPSGYTYSLVSGPAGATIDPVTGLLTWTPDPSADTATFVVAAVSNGWGEIDAVVTVPVAAPIVMPVMPAFQAFTP